MKVYGWDDTGPFRGEMEAATVDASTVNFGMGCCASEIGWERAFTSFSEAKRALIDEMKSESVDPDLIDNVRGLKASFVPVVEI
ncbi:MAG: hypothetical protein K9M17_05470 [Mariprofundaceae bacterium]|nr:hypothetical protein [Mariprofundaceae bacterium]